jgi:hypothetical protein
VGAAPNLAGALLWIQVKKTGARVVRIGSRNTEKPWMRIRCGPSCGARIKGMWRRAQRAVASGMKRVFGIGRKRSRQPASLSILKDESSDVAMRLLQVRKEALLCVRRRGNMREENESRRGKQASPCVSAGSHRQPILTRKYMHQQGKVASSCASRPKPARTCILNPVGVVESQFLSLRLEHFS